METIYVAISSIVERISENANLRTNTSFRSQVVSAEEGLRKDWEAVGNNLRWAMNEFDNQQKNEKPENTK